MKIKLDELTSAFIYEFESVKFCIPVSNLFFNLSDITQSEILRNIFYEMHQIIEEEKNELKTQKTNY